MSMLLSLMRNPVFKILFFTWFSVSLQAQNLKGVEGENFTKRVIASGLDDPWEITYGPDDFLWVTESKTYQVSRINPANGEKTVLLDLKDKRNFPRYDSIPDDIDGGKSWPQGGLMGMALHPELLQGKPFVYLCYVYEFAGADIDGTGCAANFGGCFYTSRLVRYKYDLQKKKLIKPIILYNHIPQSSDHNSGRLTIGKQNGKSYLFYTVGDMGAGQYANGGRTNNAQNIEKYEGKVLRWNLEPDMDDKDPDQWIPNDNPFNKQKQSAVWSYGHRNPQGLAFGEISGTTYLYSSEHGPFGDDEVNLIEKGNNYGHPLIIGYNDNNYNSYAAAVSAHETLPGPWNTSLPTIENENKNAKEIGKAYKDPLKVFHSISSDSLKTIFEQTLAKDSKDPEWKALAPSSIDVYTSSAIPKWKNSLLIPSLTEGKLVRLKLNEKGNAVQGDQLDYFKDEVRYRDLAISPDGTKIYLSTDKGSTSSNPSEKEDKDISCNGCILEFTYINKN